MTATGPSWGEAPEHIAAASAAPVDRGRVIVPDPNPTANPAGAGRRTSLEYQLPRHFAAPGSTQPSVPDKPLHGRRRAKGHPSVARSHRGRNTGLAVLASAVALTGSLASAHAAAPGAIPQNAAGETSVSAVVLPVSAAADARLDFDRTEVTSSPAPAAPPAAAAGNQSATPEPRQTPPTAPAVQEAEQPASRTGKLSSPAANPVANSPFGYRTNPLSGGAGELHTGLDFAAGCGTQVFSAGQGTVIEAGFSAYGGGNRIVIDHGNGLQATYNHLETIGVQLNQAVETGVRIGIAGTTGNSTGCHLHFEVLVNGQTVDPSGWL